ncbi:MAG: hypothetical protein QXF26_08350 [Candidatus Bathyarchaeia archaeon]
MSEMKEVKEKKYPPLISRWVSASPRMTRLREVKEKKYPPEVNFSTVLKGMWQVSKLDTAFHSLMAILLVTGLIIDWLGPWLGESLLPVRSIAHGYVGALFIVTFAAYLAKTAYSRKMRTVLTVTNYVDFLFYVVLIVSGVAIAAPNRPWNEVFPNLADVLLPLRRFSPTVHAVTAYVWMVFSLVFPGGLLHGLACTYLMVILKRGRTQLHE